MDHLPDDLFDLDSWNETPAEGWVRVLAEGRLHIMSVPDDAISITGAGGPAAGIVTVLAADVAELAAFLQQLAATGQPPQLR